MIYLVILFLYILVARYIGAQHHINLNKRMSTTDRAHLTHVRVNITSKAHGKSEENLLLNILNNVKGPA